MSEEHKVPSETGGTTTAITNTASQPIEPFVAPIVAAQFAFFELMIQSTVALLNMPAHQAAGETAQDDLDQEIEFSESGSTDYIEAATTLGTSWLAAPMITGIEETLDDQFFKPRPRYVQERDVLALKEWSSEFEASHVTPEAQASEPRSAAA